MRQLLLKFAEGSATLEDKNHFQNYLRSLSHKEYHALLQEYSQLLLQTKTGSADYDPALLQTLQTYIAAYEVPVHLLNTGKYKRLKYVVAAAVMITIIAGFFLLSPDKTSGSVFSTKPGEKKNFQLPDGSQVILNGAGTLTLSPNFNKENRAVTLSGEAYFDVTHNMQPPFVIHTSSMDIQVTGTAFNVRAYADEENDEASLIRGKIKVILNNTKENVPKELDLSPMQKITVPKKNIHAAMADSNTDANALHIDSLRINSNIKAIAETAWTANQLVFTDEKLEMAAHKIERWYGVSVLFENGDLKSIPYTGNFDKQNLEKVMETIRDAIPALHFKIENNKTLTIY